MVSCDVGVLEVGAFDTPCIACYAEIDIREWRKSFA